MPGSVISKTQYAFLSRRKILDGVLIANELVDEVRKKKREFMMFKTYFEKAYDSGDWRFLDYVMEKWSFMRNGENEYQNV